MNQSKSILILGSGSDIAKAIARKFAKQNYDVQLAGRDLEQMNSLRKDLTNRYNVQVSVHHFDARDFNANSTFISSLPILPNIAIYIAGYMTNQNEAKSSWEQTTKMIEVNYTGAVRILNPLSVLMGKRKSGTIVGFSSVAGDRGRRSNYIYGSAKAGFSAYLSGLRNEMFKSNVHVMTVKPGFVYTKMTQALSLPKKLTTTPEKVASKLFKAVSKNKNVLYVKPIWRWIMQIIKSIPESVFKRMSI